MEVNSILFIEKVKTCDLDKIQEFWQEYKDEIDVNFIISGRSALHYTVSCCCKNTEGVLKFLVEECGVDINFTPNNGVNNTPLHICASYNRPDFVKYLLQSGADSTIENFNGETAYDIAKKYANRRVIDIFEEIPKTKSASKT